MYENLPLDLLVAHPQNANRMSRMFAKKLQHNIGQLGKYETLTVRPHPDEKGKFQVLNGHARVVALGELGIQQAKCDVWDIGDSEAGIFLAILNRLRGSDAPELRMALLYDLLDRHGQEELAAHLPETVPHLEKLVKLVQAAERGVPAGEKPARPDVIIVDFYLTRSQHATLSKALDEILRQYGLTDSSAALAKMAELFLQNNAAGTPTV